MSAPAPPRLRALVVEDDADLGAALCSWLAGRAETEHVASVSAARALIPAFCPALVLLDVHLPDGSALDVLAELEQLSPRPVVIAITGAAGPAESFALARRGVRAFAEKPLALPQLEELIDQTLAEIPSLEPVVRDLVGRMPAQEVEESVRRVLVEEALSRADGSRRGAARLLSVSRQLLQHWLRKLGDG